MKVKIHIGTREEVEASHDTFEAMDGITVKFGQYHPVVVDGEVKHCLMDWYEEQ
jgi:hypothetical protein